MTTPCTEKEAIRDIKDGVAAILQTLNGNGEGGLKTKVQVHRVYFKLIAYIGGPILTFVAGRAIWESFIK